ncbi:MULTISPECIES: flagellar hook capping FlgD N-terminal domain-containing protein [Ferrimonas]|uniref:flagellar hook capping FlgD N-terminal domain-containing protein n=1 Tax=Ferrimonas TaxID=44011 RepID=UPI0004135659|nr:MULTISPECIES: flagellar hook capping FlgD N-terminal domain-containing protein [Ferrimonas]USD39787.1 flagellar biosynthesis protein FlgD [Ferrimonas sp. SCSIO 43195]
MSVNAVSGANGTSGNNQVAPQGNSGADLKNEFMTLMIAQIENQDPTDPLDANEYVAQLAQFSQVESLEYIRENQSTQMTMMENSAIVQSASLLGKDAMVKASDFTLGSEPIDGKVYLENNADNLQVEVLDERGQVVATVELGAQGKGDVGFSIDPEALGLAPGEYSLNTKATAGDANLSVNTFLSAPIEKIHFASASGMMMAEMGNGLGTVSVLEISEVSANDTLSAQQ